MHTFPKRGRLWLPVALALAGCSNGGGGGASAFTPPATVARVQPMRPAKAAASYLYVENNNSTISAFSVASNGVLEEIGGSPFASDTTGPSPLSIAVDPRHSYLYLTGTESFNVAIFSIDQDGALALSSDSTQVGSGAGYVLFADHGKRVDIIDEVNGGEIAVYNVEKGGAKLKALKGSPFSVTCPGFCTANPTDLVSSGAYIYSIDTYGWYVSSFSVAANGGLTELNSYATGDGPNDAAMTSNGKYLYVTDGAQANVTGYSVAAGALAPLASSPYGAGGTPDAIAIVPNNKHLYVANSSDGTISGYSVAADGSLSAVHGSPFADGSGTSPRALTIDSSGKHLFVANSAGVSEIAVYAISGSGALSQIKGSPFLERSGAAGPVGLAIDD
jgi:6-phosphogluconolactonase (cycloisomerase 2 family)